MTTKTTPFFWTDSEQANERLSQCFILYDDEPVYVNEIRPGDDGTPRAIISPCVKSTKGEERKTSSKRLDSPLFGRFRKLPQIGWINSGAGRGALFLERSSRRTTKHGLCNNNTKLFARTTEYMWGPADRNLSHIAWEGGLLESHKGLFPSLEATLTNIKEGDAIAYSRQFMIYRDTLGIKWLYRRLERIGLFTGADTLNLLRKYSFYKEELMEDPAFTVDRIQEF